MTRQTYDIITFIERIIFFLIETYFLNQCYQVILKPIIKKQSKKNLYYVVPAGYFMTAFVLYIIPMKFNNFFVSVMVVTVPFFLSFIRYKKDIILKIYITATFLSVKNIVYCLMLVEGNFVYRMLDNANAYFYSRGYEQDSIVYTIIFIIQVFLYDILRGIMLTICFRLILSRFQKKRYEYSWSELIFALTPESIGIIWGYTVNRYYIILSDLPTDIFLLILLFLGTAFILAGIITSLTMFQKLKDVKEEERDQLILSKQISNITSHIEKIEYMYDEVKGVRHDIKNHLYNMEKLLAGNHYQEAKHYMREIEATMEQLKPVCQTANPVTDIIISEFERTAKEWDIQFQMQFTFPADTGINAFDMSIVLGNALDNAMEACRNMDEKASKYISIVSERRKNCYLLYIKNSCKAAVIYNGKFPETTKGDKQLHGLGLKNIERIAKKYYGDINIVSEDNEFTLLVMMQCTNMEVNI